MKSMSKGKKGADTTDMNVDCNDPRSKCFTPESMLVPLEHFESQLSKDRTFFQNLMQRNPVKGSKEKSNVVEATLKKTEYKVAQPASSETLVKEEMTAQF